LGLLQSGIRVVGYNTWQPIGLAPRKIPIKKNKTDIWFYVFNVILFAS